MFSVVVFVVVFGGWFVFTCVVKYTILTILSVQFSDIKCIHIVVLGWVLRTTYQVLQMLLFKITFFTFQSMNVFEKEWSNLAVF